MAPPRDEDAGPERPEAWLDRILDASVDWLAWFELARPAADGDRRSAYRGDEPRRTAHEASVPIYAFDDPSAASGSVHDAVVVLVEPIGDGPELRGVRDVEFHLRDASTGAVLSLGWSGRVSGRLLADGHELDFEARDGSHVLEEPDATVLRLRLGRDWEDRDETPMELVAALEHVLLMLDR